MKTIFSVILLSALVVGGYFLWKVRPQFEADNALADRPITALVEKRDIDFAVTVAGEIAPAEQVSVRPEINGRIATLPVDLGDKVKKEEVLFTLDDQQLQNERSSAATAIDRAKLELDQAKRDFDRSQRLHEDQLISLELFENARTQLSLASNALERTRKDLAVVEERLTKAVIVAPFDCTVLTRPVSVGQAVSGSGGIAGGTEVLSIADLNQMIINAHVNQADVIRLQIGQEVMIAVEAVAGLTIQGVVERIAPQATIKNGIKGFAARIRILNKDERVQPGMTANISIPVASAENVLAVKLGAVFTDINPENGQIERYVYVKKGQSYERRPVQIGLSDYFYAEILTGVQEGEIVALEPPPENKIVQPPTAARAGFTSRSSNAGSPGVSTGSKPSSSTSTTVGTARKPASGT